MTTTLDAESQTAMSNFSLPNGLVDVTMAGDTATHNMQFSEVASHVSWNMPGPAMAMESLKIDQLLYPVEDGINLGSLGNLDASPGPQVGGPNLIARKPTSGPGYS